MKNILIAISNQILRGAYSDLFGAEGFTVFQTGDGKEALEIAEREKPSVVLADTVLSGIGGFTILKKIKESDKTKKTPVIIFSQYESKEERQEAINLEASDFLSFANVPPTEVLKKVKILLGAQKSYRIEVGENISGMKELMADMGVESSKCTVCGSKRVLTLIKDLSNGTNRFIVSFVCENGH